MKSYRKGSSVTLGGWDCMGIFKIIITEGENSLSLALDLLALSYSPSLSLSLSFSLSPRLCRARATHTLSRRFFVWRGACATPSRGSVPETAARGQRPCEQAFFNLFFDRSAVGRDRVSLFASSSPVLRAGFSRREGFLGRIMLRVSRVSVLVVLVGVLVVAGVGPVRAGDCENLVGTEKNEDGCWCVPSGGWRGPQCRGSDLYCHADVGVCSSYENMCLHQDGSAANTPGCRCGESFKQCPSDRVFCHADLNEGTCHDTELCQYQDGSVANTPGCRCGTSFKTCSSAAVFCHGNKNGGMCSSCASIGEPRTELTIAADLGLGDSNVSARSSWCLV